jgi:hypothetical protein
MVKKKLAVCGCSFMTSSYELWKRLRGVDWPEYPVVDDIKKINLPKFIYDELERYEYNHNYSFIDRFVKEKNFDYINLAQGGSSNFFIRLQIDQAINDHANYVIIGATSPNRFEIPIGSLNMKHTQEFNSKKYIMSAQISHNINALSSELISAVKYYSTYIQDNNIDSVKSYFLLQDGLTQLEKKKIPYVFIAGPMKNHDWTQNYIVWPNDKYQPWDQQHGQSANYNHNNVLAHDEYLKTLLKITSAWKNEI